jgi:hypothetical protein
MHLNDDARFWFDADPGRHIPVNVREIRLRSVTRAPGTRAKMPAILAAAAAMALIADWAIAQTTPTGPSAASTPPSDPSSFSTAPSSPCDPFNPTSPCYSANAPRNPCYSAATPDQHCSTTATPNSPSSPRPVSPPAAPTSASSRAFTKDQARAEIEAAGYSRASSLRRDSEGFWHGEAEKDGVPVNVTVDLKGNVTAD